MNIIDSHKLQIILKESSETLSFLQSVLPQDDLSSELAGYEISKLLKKQKQLEKEYAQLVQIRTSLTGIQNKKQLIEIQNKIVEVASNLKESTKKLCRLFKENPDIESDSAKVQRDRREFMKMIELLIQMVQNGSIHKFFNMTTQELEEQDKLRKLIQMEKELCNDIKQLQVDRLNETKEYEQEQVEINLKIQTFKEKLLYKKNRAYAKNSYREKEKRSEESTDFRTFDIEQKHIQDQIKNLQNKIDTENQVFQELKDFLVKKEEQARLSSDEWEKKTQILKLKLEEKIEILNKEKEKCTEELIKLRQWQEEIEEERQRIERLEIKEAKQKEENQLNLIRIDNALKLIQQEYIEWKEQGGGKKKSKGKKKK
ncbi:hypothetical protein IMG5_146510 [Ichthyophthirius multifiliis]|uniref:Uncharacterized protein n=1 Tax=Ichthyophthirius multifiliis TaxID=5932 RepID=G0QY09_ICHMU|nr:hypothetical protein IMG5_146510 [Ichthyophthirius multifiliis]EGR29878.1 hypothetical protein IMG5_146510 [Ichthyophthirius multifiliis]|eukprot:XP_004031114.1 hypothetical protein IMG5_146510 [Ichthyophthirius multifiliis]